MKFKDRTEEDNCRRSLMARICLGDPSRTLCLVPQDEAIPKREDLSEKDEDPTKKGLDYYEKRLNDFPKIEI